MTGPVYTSIVERAAPRRRLWYWEVRRDGATAGAGFRKTKTEAHRRVTETLALARAVDNTIAEEASSRPRARPSSVRTGPVRGALAT